MKTKSNSAAMPWKIQSEIQNVFAAALNAQNLAMRRGYAEQLTNAFDKL